MRDADRADAIDMAADRAEEQRAELDALRKRVAELEGGLREACNNLDEVGCARSTVDRLRAVLAGNSTGNSPAVPDGPSEK